MKSIFIILLFSISVFAQDSTQNNLSELVVTANILETGLQKTGRNVSFIDRKTIEMAPVKTIDGILQYALNVDVRSRSSFGVQADVSIRGGNFDQTLFLLDGVKINDPQTGHHSLNIPVSISQIERIEILQGGSSRVFGPSAFSGVINIVTKKITKNGGEFRVIVGQNGLSNPSFLHNFYKKRIYGSVNFELLNSKGYSHYTAFNKGIAGFKIGKNLKNGIVDLNFGMIINKFQASNFYSIAFPTEYEEIKSKFLNLSWIQNYSKTLTSIFNANYRVHNDMFDLNKFRETGKYNSINFHKTDVFDADWKVKKISKFGKTAAGLEFRSENIISNRLGSLLNIPIEVPKFDSVFYTKHKVRNTISAYVEQQNQFKKFLFSYGTLINHNSFGTALFPGIDISFLSSKNNTFYTSVNRSLRYPTFTELYLVSATVVSDPNLKPEKALSFELGNKFIYNNLSSSVSVFYRKTADAIDKIKYPTEAVPRMVNMDNLNMFGIEVSEKINLAQIYKNGFLKQLTLNYAYLKSDQKDMSFQSYYTLNYLKHKLSIGLELAILKNLTLSYWYTYKYRNGNYQSSANSALIPYKSVALMDFRLAYSKKKLNVFIDCNNFFDSKYYDFGFVQQPGRWLSTGISLKF